MQTYRTVVLGASGSGKTVFLSSMYHLLSVLKPKFGFFLQAPVEQRKLLLAKYLDIVAAAAHWPPPTTRGDLAEYKFRCMIIVQGRPHPVMEFTYLDYAGGSLTDPSEEGQPNNRVDEEVQRAHALLVLLDGHKLLRHLQGTDLNGAAPFWHDVQQLLTVIQGLENSATPIHFVLTKWDLLDEAFSLGAIRSHLMAHEDFKAIIEQRRSLRTPTRLIPVSSVGRRFATLNECGHVIKKLGEKPEPFMVEASMGCLLYDLLESTRASLDEKIQSPTYHLKRGALALTRFLNSFSRTTLHAIPISPDMVLGKLVASVAHKVASSRIGKKSAELREELERTRISIYDERSALGVVLLSHLAQIRELEEKFPESNLYTVN